MLYGIKFKKHVNVVFMYKNDKIHKKECSNLSFNLMFIHSNFEYAHTDTLTCVHYVSLCIIFKSGVFKPSIPNLNIYCVLYL